MSNDIEVLAYRVSSLEKNFSTGQDTLERKLDNIVDSINQLTLSMQKISIENRSSSDVSRIEADVHAKRIASLEENLKIHSNELTSVRLTLAERFGPGAISGLIVSLFVALLNYLRS